MTTILLTYHIIGLILTIIMYIAHYLENKEYNITIALIYTIIWPICILFFIKGFFEGLFKD